MNNKVADVSQTILERINGILQEVFEVPADFRYTPEVGESYGISVITEVSKREEKEDTYDATGVILLVGGRQTFAEAEVHGADWTFTLANLGERIQASGYPFSDCLTRRAQKSLRAKPEKQGGSSKGWIFEVICQFNCTVTATLC